MSIFSSFKVLADRGLTPEERRGVLEDLFVFGKKNQAPYLFRMGVLSAGKRDALSQPGGTGTPRQYR